MSFPEMDERTKLNLALKAKTYTEASDVSMYNGHAMQMLQTLQYARYNVCHVVLCGSGEPYGYFVQ
jgi:hypothetical protein